MSALKKLYVQFRFQQIDLLDHSGRRDKNRLRRLIEAARVSHTQKGFQLRIVH